MEQPAPLQLGHDKAHEVLVGARHGRGTDHEAVADGRRERLLELVGNLLRGADPRVLQATAARDLDELANGRVAAQLRDHAVAHGVQAAEAFQLLVGERLVERLRAEVEVHRLGEQQQAVDLLRQRLEQGALVLGLGPRLGHHRVDQHADLHAVGVTPGGHGRGLVLLV